MASFLQLRRSPATLETRFYSRTARTVAAAILSLSAPRYSTGPVANAGSNERAPDWRFLRRGDPPRGTVSAGKGATLAAVWVRGGLSTGAARTVVCHPRL